MTWFKVDDKFYSHRKVRKLAPEAIALWVLAGSYCADHLTDGVIEPSDVDWLGGTAEQARELVGAGLWDEHEAGWCFHDWEHYQPSRAAREAERVAWRERQLRHREAKKDTLSIPVPSRPESRHDSRRDITVTDEPPADPNTIANLIADLRPKLRRTP